MSALTDALSGLDDAQVQEVFEGIVEEHLAEYVGDLILRMEDVGWENLNSFQSKTSGPTITDINKLNDLISDMLASNSLMLRASQVIFAYTWGKGVKFSGVAKDDSRAKPFFDLNNKAAVFSITAYETMQMSLFLTGNFFCIRNVNTNAIYTIPFSEVTNYVTDPMSPSKLHFIERTWTSNGKKKKVWIRLARHETEEALGTSTIKINGKDVGKVDKNFVAYHVYKNRQPGWVFGVPSAMAAITGVKIYSDYLKNNARLTRALSNIAWDLSVKSRKTADKAIAQISKVRSGMSAVHDDMVEMKPMNRGNDVNFSNGQPLAAMVASAFGIPVIALLCSPGATGGSYGAAQTLDLPTIKVMEATQDSWKMFFEEILYDFGLTGIDISFPQIESDPTYRAQQALHTAFVSGGLHQDEYREKSLELNDVTSLHDELPPLPQNPGRAGSNPIPSQGNTGVGSVDQDDTNHDGDDEE
jgi:hypothetical protein